MLLSCTIPYSFPELATMIILGLDASTPKGSVALLDGECIIAESVSSSTYSDQFLVMVDEVLAENRGWTGKS